MGGARFHKHSKPFFFWLVFMTLLDRKVGLIGALLSALDEELLPHLTNTMKSAVWHEDT